MSASIIKLISHKMKIWERVLVARLRREVTIGEQNKCDVLLEKYREGWKELRCVFVEQEKS